MTLLAFLLNIIYFLWFLIILKKALLWTKLWQTKNYYVGRMLAHLETYNGKRLIYNKLTYIKAFFILSVAVLFTIGSLVSFFDLIFSKTNIELFHYIAEIIESFGVLLFFPFILPILIAPIIYTLEAGKFFFDTISEKVEKPVFTPKVIGILILSILIPILLFFGFDHFLLPLFDEMPLLGWGLKFNLMIVLDGFMPLIVTLVVLFFSLITYLVQKRTESEVRKKLKALNNLKIVAITGSYGKSTAKELIALFLSKKFNIVKTEKNTNTSFGIYDTILREVNENTDIFVVEIGAYKKNDIEKTCKVFGDKFKVGVLTGINQQHLRVFGSQENIIKAKFDIVKQLPEGGVGVVNYNSKLVAQNIDIIENKKKILCGSSQECDFQVINLKVEKEKVLFTIHNKSSGEKENFEIKKPGGEQLAEGFCLACAACRIFNIGLSEIKAYTPQVHELPYPISLYHANNLDIVASTYSSNPNSVLSIKDYVKLWGGKKVIIMPCLIELGKEAKRIHKELAMELEKVFDLSIFTTRDYEKEILKTFQNKNKVLFSSDKELILNRIKEILSDTKDSVLVLEGRSRQDIINYIFENYGINNN